MKNVFSALAIGMAASACLAQTPEWTMYGISNDGTVFSYSQPRLRRIGSTGQVYSVWTNRQAAKPSPVYTGLPQPTYTSVMSLLMLNCDSLTLAAQAATYYDSSGAVVVTNSMPEMPAPIVPGSVGESLAEKICH